MYVYKCKLYFEGNQIFDDWLAAPTVEGCLDRMQSSPFYSRLIKLRNWKINSKKETINGKKVQLTYEEYSR